MFGRFYLPTARLWPWPCVMHPNGVWMARPMPRPTPKPPGPPFAWPTPVPVAPPPLQPPDPSPAAPAPPFNEPRKPVSRFVIFRKRFTVNLEQQERRGRLGLELLDQLDQGLLLRQGRILLRQGRILLRQGRILLRHVVDVVDGGGGLQDQILLHQDRILLRQDRILLRQDRIPLLIQDRVLLLSQEQTVAYQRQPQPGTATGKSNTNDTQGIIFP